MTRCQLYWSFESHSGTKFKVVYFHLEIFLVGSNASIRYNKCISYKTKFWSIFRWDKGFLTDFCSLMAVRQNQKVFFFLIWLQIHCTETNCAHPSARILRLKFKKKYFLVLSHCPIFVGIANFPTLAFLLQNTHSTFSLETYKCFTYLKNLWCLLFTGAIQSFFSSFQVG